MSPSFTRRPGRLAALLMLSLAVIAGIGLTTRKDSEGAPYVDGTDERDKFGDAVPAGGTHVYVWPVPDRAGPGPARWEHGRYPDTFMAVPNCAMSGTVCVLVEPGLGAPVTARVDNLLQDRTMCFRRACPAALVALLFACAAEQEPAAAPPDPARYVFAWAYDIDGRTEDTNFLAVIDADSSSPTYATVVATMPTHMIGGMPHHTEQVAPPSGRPLFANAFHAGRTFLLDLNDPLAPRIAGEAAEVPGYHMPHSYYRLSNGRVLATLQFGPDSVAGRPGGVALFAADGSLLRASSSRDNAFGSAPIRTYSADISEATDRAITTSSGMDDERTADVVQLWRLSDLTLLRTLQLPEMPADSSHHYPFEVRFLPGGGQAVLNTWYCGFYLLTGLTGDTPAIERVASPDHPRYNGCGVPLLIGHWWIMPIESTHEIVVYDVSDPREPRAIHTLATDSTFVPHWTSRDPGSDRLVFPTEAHNDARILIARFDSITGRVAWDESFRDPASGRLGVSLNRGEWPHGATGPAAPHGVVFGGGRPRS